MTITQLAAWMGGWMEQRNGCLAICFPWGGWMSVRYRQDSNQQDRSTYLVQAEFPLTGEDGKYWRPEGSKIQSYGREIAADAPVEEAAEVLEALLPKYRHNFEAACKVMVSSRWHRAVRP